MDGAEEWKNSQQPRMREWVSLDPGDVGTRLLDAIGGLDWDAKAHTQLQNISCGYFKEHNYFQYTDKYKAENKPFIESPPGKFTFQRLYRT